MQTKQCTIKTSSQTQNKTTKRLQLIYRYDFLPSGIYCIQLLHRPCFVFTSFFLNDKGWIQNEYCSLRIYIPWNTSFQGKYQNWEKSFLQMWLGENNLGKISLHMVHVYSSSIIMKQKYRDNSTYMYKYVSI